MCKDVKGKDLKGHDVKLLTFFKNITFPTNTITAFIQISKARYLLEIEDGFSEKQTISPKPKS